MRRTYLLLILIMALQCLFAQNSNRKQTVSNKKERTVQTSDYSEGGVMTDEEIMEYIKAEQAKGTDSKQIVINLLKKGVPESQLNRLRKTYLEEKEKLEKQGKRKKKNINERDNNGLYERERLPISQDFGFFSDSLDVLIPDSVALMELRMKLEERPKIFGHNIFRDKALNFEPNMNIATPENYKLGPGDEVIIDVSGVISSITVDCDAPHTSIITSSPGPNL